MDGQWEAIDLRNIRLKMFASIETLYYISLTKVTLLNRVTVHIVDLNFSFI